LLQLQPLGDNQNVQLLSSIGRTNINHTKNCELSFFELSTQKTQQMEKTRPGCDSNWNYTTIFRKMVHSGKGIEHFDIDMNVMNKPRSFFCNNLN
jgi:hypothetical protein